MQMNWQTMSKWGKSHSRASESGPATAPQTAAQRHFSDTWMREREREKESDRGREHKKNLMALLARHISPTSLLGSVCYILLFPAPPLATAIETRDERIELLLCVTIK